MKKYFSLVCFIIISTASSAQTYLDMMYDNNYNFYQVVDSANAYFNTIDKSVKGNGYKPFLRWKHNNESKFAPSGIRNNTNPYLAAESFQKIIQQKNTRAINNAWRELGPTNIGTITGHYAVGLGRIEDVYVHPSNMNIIYAGTRSGGFYKSINGGLNWQTKFTDSLFATGVNAIGVSPTNADSILINVRNSYNNTSHGIYRSINGGNTWKISNFNPTTIMNGGLGTSFQIYKIFYHPTIPNLIFIGTNQGLYKSTDNLATWTRPYNSGQITQIAFHPTNANIMYIYDNVGGGANENKVLVSVNTGTTFTPSLALTNNANNTLFLSTTTAAPNNVYVGSSTGFWKSTDSGKKFTFIIAPPLPIRAMAVHTSDSNKVVSGYVDMQNSINGGVNFTKCTWWSLGSTQHNGTNNSTSFANSNVYTHADMDILKCVNGIYFGGSDGFVCKSADNGVTWTRLAEGLGIRENYCVGTSQSNHYVSMVGSQDNGESIKNKKGWIEFYGADGMESLVHPLNEDWLIGSVQYGNRRRTKDGGLNQDDASVPNISDGAWVAPLLNDPIHQMRLYDFTDSIFVSEDFGSNWVYKGKPTFIGNISQAAIANNDSKIMIVSNGSSIQKSIDAGVTWVNTKNNLPTKTYSDITFDPNYDNVIAVTFDNVQADNQKIYITTNGGTSWNNITYNLGNMPLYTVVIDHTPQRNMYVGAEIGVYVKPMKDTVWQLYNTNLPNMTVADLEICWGSNTLKAATWGRGLWENSLKDRKDFPAIVRTIITNPPTDDLPKESVDQFVTSDIHYTNTLSKVYVMYGINTINLTNKLDMVFLSDSSWKTISPIPNQVSGTKIYFKVFAIGSNNDTTSTYRFMYTIKPFTYCDAMGFNDGGNLHIQNVTIDNINNTTINNTYSYNNNPILNLNKGITYNLSITGSTNWSENDYGAWIDYNGDKIFDKTTEQVLLKLNNGNQATASFTIPNNYNGNDTFRMRVRLSYWDDNPDPCGTTLGEVEDYAIQLNYPNGIPTVYKQEIAIYPNPSNNMLTIKLATAARNPIIIYGANGQVVKTILANNTKSIIVDISDLSVGVYQIKSGAFVAKFIKQ